MSQLFSFKNMFSKKEEVLNFDIFNLMYKDIPVAVISNKNDCISIIEIYNRDLFPVSLENIDDRNAIIGYFKSWLSKRCIPNARTNLAASLSTINIKDTFALSYTAFGVSLNDQYWYKPQGSKCSWDDINPFKNKYSHDLGDILLNPNEHDSDINIISPDATTQGVDAKRWIVDEDNESYLIKANINCEQVACNEVLASEICRRLGINSVVYGLVRKDVSIINHDNEIEKRNCLFASSKNFCDEHHRYVTAHSYKADMLCINEREFIFNVLLSEEFRQDICKMVVLDFLIVNEDRHYNNFGFLIDESGGVKFAPIYDSGNSMYFNSDIKRIGMQEQYSSIAPTYQEALKLCFVKPTDFDWYDANNLNDISSFYKSILEESNLEWDRIAKLCVFLDDRIKQLDDIIKTLKKNYVNLDEVINASSDINGIHDKAEIEQGFKIVNGKVVLTTMEAQKECKQMLETKQIHSVSQYPACVNAKNFIKNNHRKI